MVYNDTCSNGLHQFEFDPMRSPSSYHWELQCRCGASWISVRTGGPHEFGRITVGFKDEDEDVDRAVTRIWRLQEVGM